MNKPRISCLLTAITLLFFISIVANAQEGAFSATLIVEEEIINYRGDSDFTNSPSLFSIYFAPHLRCGFHFNITDKLNSGTYKISNKEGPSMGARCVRRDIDEPERLDSVSGEIVIEELTSNIVRGSVDMLFEGAISGKKYQLSGEFSATPMQ